MDKIIRLDTKNYAHTKQAVAQKLANKLKRELSLAQTDAAFKKLKQNKKAWAQELAERADWDAVNDLEDDVLEP